MHHLPRGSTHILPPKFTCNNGEAFLSALLAVTTTTTTQQEDLLPWLTVRLQSPTFFVTLLLNKKMLRRHFKRRNYFAAAAARRADYRWCGVEQVDQAAPIPTRSNGWRYRGERERERPTGARRYSGPGSAFAYRSPGLSPGPGHR